MKIKTFFYAFAIAGFFVASSCSKDDKNEDPGFCNANWFASFEAEVEAVTTTGTAFYEEQTLANCNAYKTALNNYINALEPLGNCAEWPAQTRADWQDYLDNAKADLADFTCDN